MLELLLLLIERLSQFVIIITDSLHLPTEVVKINPRLIQLVD